MPSSHTMDTDMAPFLKSVQGNPCLWNPEHKSYAETATREAAWTKIVRKHHMADVTAAKKNWKALRDTHREVMKRHWANGGVHKHKPWRYFKHMAFLVPHMSAKPKESIEPHQSEDDESKPKKRKTKSSSGVNEQTEDDVESGVGIECKTELTELQSGSESTKDQDSYFYAVRKPASMSGAVEDPLSKFFNAMCDTARMLPEIYQLEIKRKLFNAVSDAEEHYLNSHT